jgi:uncharacterized protein YcbK (DUF882 family)
MGDLSPHFDSSEFACKHCGQTKTPPKTLIDALEKARSLHYPHGLPIVSGYRCPAHNAAVKGKPNSRHLAGDAADIPPAMTIAQAQALGFRGIGSQDSNGLVVHVDMRRVRATWTYDAAGHTP